MASVQYTSILDSLSDGIKRFKIMERMNFYFALIALVIIITDLIFYKINKKKNLKKVDLILFLRIVIYE